MGEIQPFISSIRPIDRHFNVSHGSQLVAARQAVYYCLEGDRQPPDYGVEIVNTLAQAGVSDRAKIVDVGCSFPWDLKLLQLAGHTGELIGIDPNTAQFKNLPYWEIRGSREQFLALLAANDEAGLGAFLKRRMGNSDNEEFAGITLMKGWAHFIPLRSGMVDVVISSFSAQQWDEARQRESFAEIKRILRPNADYAASDALTANGRLQAGLFAKMASGERNKCGIHERERAISEYLSQQMSRRIIGPVPMQAGFTYEKGLKVLPHAFRYIHIKYFQEKIVFDSRGDKEIALNSYRSLFDQYMDEGGNIVPEAQCEKALQEVVGREIEEGIRTGNYVTDVMDRAETVCSDALHHLEGFELVNSR